MKIGELFLFAFFCKTGKFKRIAIVVVSVNKVLSYEYKDSKEGE